MALSTCSIDLKNVDTTTLVRHVALTQSTKVIKALKLTEVVPVPKSMTTFKSFVLP